MTTTVQKTLQLFTTAILATRKHRHMSQRELAAACDVSHGYISHVEAGRRCPSLPVFIRICEVLRLTIALRPEPTHE